MQSLPEGYQALVIGASGAIGSAFWNNSNAILGAGASSAYPAVVSLQLISRTRARLKRQRYTCVR